MRLFLGRKLLLLFMLALPIVAFWPAAAEKGPGMIGPAHPSRGPVWNPFPGIEISAEGAGIPQIAVAPNGELMIVYNHWVTGRTDRDPYFAVSFNGGSSWTPGIPIVASAGVDSLQLDVAYDDNSVAHAVWVQLGSGNFQLKYRQHNAGVWGTDRTISSVISSNPLLASPALYATGSNTLDVVWVEADQNSVNPTLDVYHARSTNSGSTWTVTGTVASSLLPTSQHPDLFVDENGIVYVVWEEAAVGGESEIRLVRSDSPPNNATVTWTEIDAPISSLDSDITHAQQPAILNRSGTIYVVFADVRDSGDTQTVVRANCTGTCTSIDDWTLATISGDAVGVNSADPFAIVPELAQNDASVFAYFHGTLPDLPDDNEAIIGVNECEGWASGGRDLVTPTNTRSINPAIVATEETLHLAYELVTPGNPSDVHQIHYMFGSFNCGRFIYLPVVALP